MTITEFKEKLDKFNCYLCSVPHSSYSMCCYLGTGKNNNKRYFVCFIDLNKQRPIRGLISLSKVYEMHSIPTGQNFTQYAKLLILIRKFNSTSYTKRHKHYVTTKQLITEAHKCALDVDECYPVITFTNGYLPAFRVWVDKMHSWQDLNVKQYPFYGMRKFEQLLDWYGNTPISKRL